MFHLPSLKGENYESKGRFCAGATLPRVCSKRPEALRPLTHCPDLRAGSAEPSEGLSHSLCTVAGRVAMEALQPRWEQQRQLGVASLEVLAGSSGNNSYQRKANTQKDKQPACKSFHSELNQKPKTL